MRSTGGSGASRTHTGLHPWPGSGRLSTPHARFRKAGGVGVGPTRLLRSPAFQTGAVAHRLALPCSQSHSQDSGLAQHLSLPSTRPSSCRRPTRPSLKLLLARYSGFPSLGRRCSPELPRFPALGGTARWTRRDSNSHRTRCRRGMFPLPPRAHRRKPAESNGHALAGIGGFRPRKRATCGLPSGTPGRI